MEDELMTVLRELDSGTIEKAGERAKQIGQGLANVGAEPDYTQDVAEMRRRGLVWDGYRWVKP